MKRVIGSSAMLLGGILLYAAVRIGLALEQSIAGGSDKVLNFIALTLSVIGFIGLLGELYLNNVFDRNRQLMAERNREFDERMRRKAAQRTESKD